MFLQKIYKHNRWLFIAMVLFIIAQLFINFKRGMVVSPLYHYGMYSEVMNVKGAYTVYEVEVNGRRLKAEDFTPQEWDKIIQPLVFYSNLNKSNALYETDIKRLMSQVHLSAEEKNFVQSCDSVGFNMWYQSYLKNLLRYKINLHTIQCRLYRFKSGHMELSDSTIALSPACN